MIITPYKSSGPLRFGYSTRDECLACLGQPQHVRKNRQGVEEYYYDGFIVRFDANSDVVGECTVLPKMATTIDGIEVTWDMAFLKTACERDGAPLDVYGFIVLKKLGIAVTGIHDKDPSQLAVTAFSENAFDDFLSEATPFHFSSCVK